MHERIDPRRRAFLPPTRVVWTAGDVSHADRLVSHDGPPCVLAPGAEPASILIDFGRELHGGVRFEAPTTSTGRPAQVRVRFGESVSEAMAEPNNDHTIHDFTTQIAWMGYTEIGCTGFRFVRVDLLDSETSLTLDRALAVTLMRPEPMIGDFECSDPRLNEIWCAGAHTVHLCMQDAVWDGIKRDRLVWIGDLHPEACVIANVFGAHPIVPESLDFARAQFPLPQWMNGISSYSLWWIILQRDWYLWSGDLEYLRAQHDTLTGMLELVASHVGPDGSEHLDGARFLEWPTSEDPAAIDIGLQALVVLALDACAGSLAAIGDNGASTRASALAQLCRAAPARPHSPSKQAAALQALAGMRDAKRTNDELLSVDPMRGLSTFYGFYILHARAMAGDHAGCLELIRTYWGGMLDLGATSFWEHFELDWLKNAGRIDELPVAGQHDVHREYGNWCFKGLRHSLCHGWAAGPTAWLMTDVLGVTPAAPGFREVHFLPHLAGLEWARGRVPTPFGLIEVSLTRGADGTTQRELRLPDGVRIADA